MIQPTDTDHGRRVRWLGHNFGELIAADPEFALVRFDDADPAKLPHRELWWADGVGVTFVYGDQEPAPRFPYLRRVRPV